MADGQQRSCSELGEVGREKSEGFERIESYERLIKLRAESPDLFMLQTSQATRYALTYYERARQTAEGARGK